MLRPILAALACSTLCTGGRLATDYTAERALRVSAETKLSLETTSFEMTRDGEPVNAQGGGSSSTMTRKIVHVDRVKAHEKDKPTKVDRAFEEVGGHTKMSFGETEREDDQESPLEGVTLEISVDDKGEVSTKVIEGKEPKESDALEGHRAELALDALLPHEDVAEGKSWELDRDAIRCALLTDVQKALFPRKEETADEGGGGPRPRGGMRGGPGGGSSRLLEIAEWTGKAKLTGDEEKNGLSCAVIEVELQAKGDMPQAPAGEGRRRRGDALEGELAPISARSNTYKIKLEGKLYYARAEKRPLLLELEGSMAIERDEDRPGRDDVKMHIKSTQEGTLTHTVKVSKAE